MEAAIEKLDMVESAIEKLCILVADIDGRCMTESATEEACMVEEVPVLDLRAQLFESLIAINEFIESITVWASSIGNKAISVAMPSPSGYIRTERVSRCLSKKGSKLAANLCRGVKLSVSQSFALDIQ
ncbi:MAG: hypothetical protein RLZZ486_800 [Actinomycetota bacterium]